MSDYERKPNTGSLFKNESATGKQPEYTGKVLITPDMAGKEIYIAAWVNESKNGKYFSLKFSAPMKKNETPQSHVIDDDIPF